MSENTLPRRDLRRILIEACRRQSASVGVGWGRKWGQRQEIRNLEEVFHSPADLVFHVVEDMGIAPQGHSRVGMASWRGRGVASLGGVRASQPCAGDRGSGRRPGGQLPGGNASRDASQSRAGGSRPDRLLPRWAEFQDPPLGAIAVRELCPHGLSYCLRRETLPAEGASEGVGTANHVPWQRQSRWGLRRKRSWRRLGRSWST